jgi:hypothetical protein
VLLHLDEIGGFISLLAGFFKPPWPQKKHGDIEGVRRNGEEMVKKCGIQWISL